MRLHPTLRAYFSQYRLNAILVTNLVNVRSLAGFTGTNGAALLMSNQKFFCTDFRYREQAKKEVRGFKLVEAERDLYHTLAKLAAKLRVRRLGFEAGAATYAQYARLKGALRGVTLVPITEDPALLRIIKTPDEIKKLTRALRINKLAWEEIKPQIKPGVREFEVALMLEFALREHGAEKLAFDTIVASGWRGALPHGKASAKRLKKGELVTIDFGGVYQGYHADETVTVCLGRPSAEQKKIHRIVLDAQKYAMEKVRPGVKCSIVDKAARDYITSKGFGKYFGHALGHGVGLEVHERPVLSENSPDIIKPGMVFTIEPGIYIPGWGGVRVEDVFECTKSEIRKTSLIDKSVWGKL